MSRAPPRLEKAAKAHPSDHQVNLLRYIDLLLRVDLVMEHGRRYK